LNTNNNNSISSNSNTDSFNTANLQFQILNQQINNATDNKLTSSSSIGSGSSSIPTTIHIVNNNNNNNSSHLVAGSSLPANLINNSPKQTPIKIRNFISNANTATLSPSASTSTLASSSSLIANINKACTSLTNVIAANSSTPTTPILQRNQQQTTPLRALVINSNTSISTTNQSNSSPIPVSAPPLIPLALVANLQKQYFPNVKFKCLNFEELAVSLFVHL
jgi:hypothetical protein